MAAGFQIEGKNSDAPFTFKIHRGDGMALLAMNWRKSRPPRDFVGFAIEYREPDGDRFYALKNRIGFPGQRVDADEPTLQTTSAPIQKFRWVHFPRQAAKEGLFRYRVTPMFMNAKKELSAGEPQEADIALMRETVPGKLNVAFTRGFVSSQAFVSRYAPDGTLAGLIPEVGKEGLSFKPKHPKATEAYEWMGFEARAAILRVLDEAIASKADVRVIAYDLNLPEMLTRLEALGTRLKIIIDDSAGTGGGHKAPDSPESKSAARLRKTAGAGHVVRQNMGSLQHHKSIAVRGKNLNKVVYGSTNFTWRGFFVQSNNAVIVSSTDAVDTYFDAFDDYFTADGAADFRASSKAEGWHSLGIAGLDAKVGFSPHTEENGLLASVGMDIGRARTSVLFSLAFLGQMKRGPVGPALGKAIKDKNIHTMGIADARVKEGNLGIAVMSANDKTRVVRSSALTGNVPPPFKTEPSGLSGSSGNHRGTRMHHKFVVLDFNTEDARVYLGSYNFSEPADFQNGENLVLVKDRTVATSYMIEAVRMYDHYRFRSRHEDEKKTGGTLELKFPPSKASQKTWFDRDWDDPVRAKDRELFA
ncbi:MAG: phospholipase D-like domain-containing protein [Bosea sp. (in: a-proteobacteria)]